MIIDTNSEDHINKKIKLVNKYLLIDNIFFTVALIAGIIMLIYFLATEETTSLLTALLYFILATIANQDRLLSNNMWNYWATKYNMIKLHKELLAKCED